MPASDIVIQGAREHNLRDVSLVLPRNQLICLTGVSGSGKSSLAFDTVYAEGQRRYVESLSSYARQFLGQMPKPDVDFIGGLSPSISISQKSTGNNPRSTVGTITEIYDYLRVLYARVGQGHCPQCQRPITAQSREQILARILQLPDGTKFSVLAPLIRQQKGEYKDLFVDLLKQGFVRARVDGQIVQLSDNLSLDRQMRHDIEVVIDRLAIREGVRPRLSEAVEMALKMGEGNLVVAVETISPSLPPSVPPSDDDETERPSDGGTERKASKRRARAAARDGDILFSSAYACTHCNLSFEPPSPQLFSFNSPQGMCPSCMGLGEMYSFDPALLIPNSRLSFKDGAIEILGPWHEMGRWRRHVFQGVADTMERKASFKKGTMLDEPWNELPDQAQKWWLYGTGKEHITFTWRAGSSPMMYGGKFEGIIPELDGKYRNSKSVVQQRQLARYMSHVLCPACHGDRLLPQARAVRITSRRVGQDREASAGPPSRDIAIKGGPAPATGGLVPPYALTLPEVCKLAISDAAQFFQQLDLDPTQQLIAAEVLKEIRTRLGFLIDVGLEYLTLDRTAPTLAGGESQRIRLAGQIGSGLVGVLYILDEPSIGLHPRDNERLLATLRRLRDMGNTVIVVEHDEETMWCADHIIDFGPGPGVRGGHIVASGPPGEVIHAEQSITAKYLSGEQQIEVPKRRREVRVQGSGFGVQDEQVSSPKSQVPSPNKTRDSGLGARDLEPVKVLKILGAAHNNLKNIDVEIPLGAFVCVTGVSGSGKSSLVGDIVVEALHRDLNKGEGNPGAHRAIEGMEHLDKLIDIDQSPIGRTPRSNPGTYIKVFDEIRDLFSQLPEAKKRGFKPGRFSFNVEGGRCEACEGNGSNRLEMDFLADVWVTCPVCEGKRFSRETLQVRFKEKSIADVLDMDVQQALGLFENVPHVRHKLQTLHDVGLDYIKIGQPSPTLSGGEAQRIKLAKELVKKSTGKTLYLLDEPTTGLHFADIRMLLKVLHNFVDAGNTVLVVEHNLDVVKTADWIIDLGPEGGEGGGRIIAVGTPEEIARHPESHTGRVLAKILDGSHTAHLRELAKERAANGGTGVQGSKFKVRGSEKRSSRSASTLNLEPGTLNSQNGHLATHIVVKGARQHNLKGVDASIERDRMTVFCGPSGSGKSSLAMDTIYAEGQRRYVESLSAYARQFVAQMQKPAVDHIDGLSPAIAIEQKNLGHTPRSTVGTVTEIYDYFRILMARLGQPYCPECDVPVGTQSADQVVDAVMSEPLGTRLYLMAPVEIDVGQQYGTLWEELRATGYQRVRIDSVTHALDAVPEIDRRRKHQVEVVLDRITIQPQSRSRIAGSIEQALALGKGVMTLARVQDGISEQKWETVVHSQHMACHKCGRSFEPLTPHSFSFNSPLGWCNACEGLGVQLGANPMALLRDPKLTLAQGALALWPNLDLAVSRAMLQALADGTGVPLEVPFEKLSQRQRRIVLHGAGDEWFEARVGNGGKVREGSPAFWFQFKGLYPALEEASRLSPLFRMRLEHLVGEVECGTCGGSRLRDDASAVRFREKTLGDLGRMPLTQLSATIADWNLSSREKKIAGELVREITGRLQFLLDVGLDYLSLSRPAATLSNGEAQRIRLASQLGSGLCGVLYVLDEPTIGLHPRDNTKLLKALHKLRDLGNTLLVVEHDREVIQNCDRVIDFGPGAGKFGGQVVADAEPERLGKQNGSVTGPYLTGKKAIAVPKTRRIADFRFPISDLGRRKGRNTKKTPEIRNLKSEMGPCNGHPTIEVVGARHNNLRNINVQIPLGTLTAITGVSGSGKSTLVDEILYSAIARRLHRAALVPGAHDDIKGLEHINKVIRVDQQPLGNSPTSNPATYTGCFELIRTLFAQLPDAKLRGYSARRFSFNVPGGRCEACEGNGQRRIEMHFLPDVWVECETCRGRRYNPETLAVMFHGHSVSDVLDMTCGEAVKLFENIPKIRRVLQTLCDVGLDYLTLGQPAPTLSGGEAQRVKLAAELSRPDTGRTLYLLDEPTTGLHFDDLAKLLEVLQRLVDLGNTVVVIEHNLDVIKCCDWIIDLGPEAGEGGGNVVASGTPEMVADDAGRISDLRKAGRKKKFKSEIRNPKSEIPFRSHTGIALAPVLAAGPFADRVKYDPAKHEQVRATDLDISDVGKDAKMPWEKDGRKWHTQDRVGRTGEACRWDGRILARVVDRIHELGEFSETDWSQRSVVEISATKKSDGWFFHAITGETWLIKLKFRVYKGTFKRDDLLERIELKTLNELADLPIYGNEPRVKVKSSHGPWQEVEIRAHTLEEIDTPEFWSFVEEAVRGFFTFTEKAQARPEDIAPWKILGQKWHFLRKGFPPGRMPKWSAEVWEELFEILKDMAPEGQFLWNNQQLVHLVVPQQREPWASVHTKRPQALTLSLTGPKGKFALGRILEFGSDREIDDTRPDRDVLRIHLTEAEQIHREDFQAFLKEHLNSLA